MDLCKVNKLKFQEELLDKHIATLLNNLNSILYCDELNVSRNIMEEQRKHLKCRFNNEMTEIQSYVVKLEQIRQQNLQHPSKVPDDLNSAIVAIKNANIISLQNLAVMEETCARDLEVLDQKIGGFQKTKLAEKILKPIGEPCLKNRITRQVSKTEGVTSEVREFQTFLETSGGHTGGWDHHDHQLFLKHRLKLKGVCMTDALHILLPDISPEIIAAHDEWYKQYEVLRSKQASAIKTWREGSRKDTHGVSTAPTCKEKLKMVKTDPVVLKVEAEKKRQLVREWKLKKQELKLIEENKEAKKLHKIGCEELTKFEEREKQKRILQEYKLKKALLKEAYQTRLASEEAKKQSHSNIKLLAMFQERDQLHITRMIKRVEERKRPLEECIPDLPMVVAERDPDRLLRPTKAWAQHIDHQEELEPTKITVGCNYVNHLPRLKVPNWRKNL